MAANMQHMAAAGQMMPQQMQRKPVAAQLNSYVYHKLISNPAQTVQPWHGSVSTQERLAKALDLISNMVLGWPNMDRQTAADQLLTFEWRAFNQAPSKVSQNEMRAPISVMLMSP
jgi:BarA-like signal transduction histidine kinase